MRPALSGFLLAGALAQAQVSFQAAPDKIAVAIAGQPFSNLHQYH